MSHRIAFFKSWTRAWIRKHARFLFSVTGAFVVLATFMTREALRERQKEVADRISAAQLVYGLEEIKMDVRGRLDEIRNQFYKLGKYLQARGRPRPGIDFASRNRPKEMLMFESNRLDVSTSETADNLSGNDQKLEMIRPLLEQLPKDEALENRWRALKKQAGAQTNLFRKFANSTTHVDYERMPTEQGLSLVEEELRLSNELLDSTSQTSFALGHFVEDVVKVAQTQKRNADEAYSFWTKLSYVLYPLGVLMALVGRFYGAEVPGLG
jgi:hypothetical protein